MIRGIAGCCVAISVWLLSGCSSAPEMMPTPNIYSCGDIDPFPSVSPELQSNQVDVLYVRTIIGKWSKQLMEVANRPASGVVKDSSPFELHVW